MLLAGHSMTYYAIVSHGLMIYGSIMLSGHGLIYDSIMLVGLGLIYGSIMLVGHGLRHSMV